MKKILPGIVIVFACTISFHPLCAQSVLDSTNLKQLVAMNSHHDVMPDAKKKPSTAKKSRLEAGLSFENNDVYLGRKDSSILPYFIPVLSYYHKSGLYFSANMNYLKNSQSSRVDLIMLEGGYAFTAGKYDGQFMLTKFLYSGQSTNVSSDIQASIGYQNGYDFGFIKPFMEMYLLFGSKADYQGTFGLQHSFSGLHNKLELTPTVLVNAGTQNFYDNYYKNRRYSNRGKGQNGQSGGLFAVSSVASPSDFKVLDYEASLPISYTYKKFVFNFTPNYAIPVNPSAINTTVKQTNGTFTTSTETENLTNSFYWTIGVVYQFQLKH